MPTGVPKLPDTNDFAGKSGQDVMLGILRPAAVRLSPTNRGRYRHWDEPRDRQAPNALTPADHWLAAHWKTKEGLLMMHKEGKKFVFTPAGEMGRRVRG